ncbi:MAG: type III pantothenate kinase [Halieaceae bacterium]|nr:type III pantothenate kinase [Halieaceae bacterium]
MILLLDVGNTLVKWRLQDAGRIPGQGARPRGEVPGLLEDIAKDFAAVQVWISSVANSEYESSLGEQVCRLWRREPWFARTEALSMGLRNSYRQPAQLGVDRWLAMLAAWKQARSSVCVVDSGSALTIDFVSPGGEHRGGYILPGLDSMQQALLSNTDRVLCDAATPDQLKPGNSTEEAVDNGLLLAQAGAVALALQRLGGNFSLIFTGGNGAVLQRCLQLGGVYSEHLVLDGLYLLGQSGTRSGVDPA